MIYKASMDAKGDILEDSLYKGYRYLVISRGTHPCAYVKITPNNKLYEDNRLAEDEICCHGGITFCGRLTCLYPDESYFIGWDYAHYGDFVGYDKIYKNLDPSENKKWTTKEIVQQAKEVIDQVKLYEEQDIIIE